MNLIEIKTTCLKTNKEALYKDIFIDDTSFQDLLKENYQKEFSEGRFKEVFIPCLIGSRENSIDIDALRVENFLPTSGKKLILPVYGCQDGCCVYVYILISIKNNHIVWEKVGRNNAYVRDQKNSKEKIEWLTNFKSLQFNDIDYKNALHQLK
jgi:hypothetical protein|tara:strand:+ start:3551 stop:4009 length:459 start_codon:yes stop_codon:yes gene_type:complete